jgi:flagellar motor switch protein FliM
MDRELSAAIVEMRTTGRVRDKPGPDRRATAADIALAEPLFSALLNELSLTTDQTVLDGWTAGVRVQDRVPSVREIGLALPENVFRYMTVQVDLGAGDRKGNLWLAWPDARVAAPAPVVSGDTVDWALEMEETVMESPAVLEAILHRSKFPLSRLTDLHVGQVIPLPGCSVASIRLEALDGTFVGRGRIGQMGGNMAVRIEAPAASLMTDLEGHASHADNMPDAMSLPDHNDGLASDVGGMDFAPDPSFDAGPLDQIAQAEEIPQQLEIATEDLPITDIDMSDFEMGDFPDLPSEAS